jgi:hypothetical protein
MGVRKGKLTLQRIIELYESGMETGEIAEQNGYQNDRYIIQRLRSAGYAVVKSIDTGKVMALHRAGWSSKDIAYDMNLPINKVEGVLNERH